MRPFSWENSYNPFVISQWVYYWMLMRRIIKISCEHVFKYISTAEFSPTKFPRNDVAKGNGFRWVLVTVKSPKSAKRWVHSKALRVFMHAPGNYHNLEKIDGKCFSARLLSLLWHCCTKIKFHSADSCVLQFIDPNWTLKWDPRNVRNSVRCWSS